jgi:hypothetical protein
MGWKCCQASILIRVPRFFFPTSDELETLYYQILGETISDQLSIIIDDGALMIDHEGVYI